MLPRDDNDDTRNANDDERHEDTEIKKEPTVKDPKVRGQYGKIAEKKRHRERDEGAWHPAGQSQIASSAGPAGLYGDGRKTYPELVPPSRLTPSPSLPLPPPPYELTHG